MPAPLISVVLADRGRAGVAVGPSGFTDTAGCGSCKSEVIGHMIFSHRQVLVEMRHVHNIAHLTLGFFSGVLVHPRRIERPVGAFNGVPVLPCPTERAVGCSLPFLTLPRHTVRVNVQNGGVADSASFNLLASH